MAIASVRGRSWPVRSRAGRIGIVVLGIAIVLMLAVWAATILLRPHPPSPEAITRAMRTQAALTGGEKAYVTHCAYCHDTGFGPGLAHLGLPPMAVRAIVRRGPGMMPAFTPSEVGDADIDAVTSYVDALPPRKAPP